MGGNKLAFAVIGAACIIAAGAGSYVALRQNAALPASPATVAASQPTGHPVSETEDFVNQAPVPKPAAPPASPKTVTAPASSTKHDTTPVDSRSARHDSASASDRNWPAANPAPASVPTPLPEVTAPIPPRPLETVERLPQEQPALLPEPPQKSYEELVVSADSVIGLQSESTVSSDRARVEDRVEARVTRDVRVGNRIAIPAGSRAIGTVSQVERGGKFKEHGRIAIRFQTVILADGTRLPISTDAVIREGSSPGSDTTKKIGGGAVAGTILGAIIGGSKGAAIGGVAGAGVGTGVVAAGDRSVATLHAGEPMTIRLLSPVTVVTER